MLLLFSVESSVENLEFATEVREKGLDGFLVAPEEMPLADLAAAHQACALQGRQMRRDGGLRKSGALVDLPGADAVFQRILLIRKVALRVLQPAQDVAAQRMGEGLDDVVERIGHGLFIFEYRDGANYISGVGDMRSNLSMVPIEAGDVARGFVQRPVAGLSCRIAR